jgi:hypothetical protein
MRAVKGSLDHSLEQMFGAEEEMEPDDLLCSRNARPQKALVGRAQWEINQPPSLKRKRASLEGTSVSSLDGRSRTKHGCRSAWEKQT